MYPSPGAAQDVQPGDALDGRDAPLRQNARMDERSLRVIPATDYRRSRWRNGRGWTREILALPDVDAWDLRLSIAELDAVADFSPFPGMAREQVLLSGNGLQLHFDDGEVLELLPPHQRARFDGVRPVTGIPLDGPVQVFNLMWRPDAVAATLFHRPLVGGMWCFGDERTAWAVYLLAGSARIGCEGEAGRFLAQGDSAWLPRGPGGRRYSIDGGGELLLVQALWPAQDAVRADAGNPAQ
jgi:environmental stress-induced protein Ves